MDLAAERKNGDFVRGLIEAGRIKSVHDVSDGGVMVAIAEMALKGNTGVEIGPASLPEAIPFFFGEDQGRYLLAAPVEEAERIVQEARKAYIRSRSWAGPAATPSSDRRGPGDSAGTPRGP